MKILNKDEMFKKMKSGKHSILPPSSYKSWINVEDPKIIVDRYFKDKEEKGEINPYTLFACQRGTILHMYLAYKLSLALDLNFKKFAIDLLRAKEVYTITEEDKLEIDNIVKYVVKLVGKDDKILIEKKVYFQDKYFYGSSDILIYKKDLKQLIVIDYKSGYVEVDIKTGQLVIYVLGAVRTYFKYNEIEEVYGCIIQPKISTDYQLTKINKTTLKQYERLVKKQSKNVVKFIEKNYE